MSTWLNKGTHDEPQRAFGSLWARHSPKEPEPDELVGLYQDPVMRDKWLLPEAHPNACQQAVTGCCLVVVVALQRDVATTAAVEPAQAHKSTLWGRRNHNSGTKPTVRTRLKTEKGKEGRPKLAPERAQYDQPAHCHSVDGALAAAANSCRHDENFRVLEGAIGLTRWFEKLESQFGISNVAEGDKVKFASSTLLDSALTWWNVYVRSVTLDTAHATPWSDFKAMFIRKYCPRNEVKQMENELWNLKGNVTSSKPVDLHEVIEMAQGLMYQVVQELGENSGDKRKWNGNHYNNNNPNTTSNLYPKKRPETARVFTAGQGQDIRSKTAEPHPVLQAKEDPEAKEDREVMLLALDVVKRDTTRTSVRTIEVKAVEIKFEATNKILKTIRGKIKETLREITNHQPALKKDAEHLTEYTAYVLRLL
ncbi:reverse transcriptase domain-containing protein [Tanacetum coccineum]